MKSIFLTIIFLAFDMTVDTEKEKSASSSSKIEHKIAKTYLFVKYTECRSLVRLVPVISDALIKLIIF